MTGIRLLGPPMTRAASLYINALDINIKMNTNMEQPDTTIQIHHAH
jgi:hypothetical protein